MKKLLALILALAMCLAVTACGATTEEPAADNAAETTEAAADDIYAGLEPVELTGADPTCKGAAGQIFGENVAALVKESTGGNLTIDDPPNGDLGGDADLLRQMQSNDIQIVVCQTAPTVSFIPEMAVFDLPMVFSKYDGDTIDAVLNGEDEFSAALNEAYEAAGLHLLGFLQNATYRLTTAHTDLSTLDSFQALQIRTMENSNHMAFWTAIGAQPTPLAWAEVYIALQNGTIDAQENAADTCVGASLQEVQEYLACTNHILYCNQICINAEAYDALDPAYQDALNQAVADAIAYMRPQLEQIDQDNKQILVDGGMTLIEYDAAFYDEILALDSVQALYDDIDQNQINGLGAKLVAALEG